MVVLFDAEFDVLIVSCQTPVEISASKMGRIKSKIKKVIKIVIHLFDELDESSSDRAVGIWIQKLINYLSVCIKSIR